jgi:hypothetical protein
VFFLDDANVKLTLKNITITGGAAGGIFNVADLTLINCSVSGNTNTADGGGIYSLAKLQLTNSTVSQNTAAGKGGGIFSFGQETLTNSTVSGNTAVEGGGIYNNNISIVSNTTVSGNTASSQYGGIAVPDGGSLLLKKGACSNLNSVGSDSPVDDPTSPVNLFVASGNSLQGTNCAS